MTPRPELSLVLLVATCALAAASPSQSLQQFDVLRKTDLPVVSGSEHAVGDFDKDGDLDVLVMDAVSGGMLLGDGKGGFRLVPHGLPSFPFQDIAAGDVDGDGDLDVVAAVAAPWSGSGQTRLYLNDGKGKLIDTTANMPVDSLWSASIALGDVDGDKDLDVVIGNASWNQLSRQNALYLNDGKGRFTDVTATHMPVDSDDTGVVELGDLDLDGDLDIFVGNGRVGLGEANRIYLNDGKGKFTSRSMPGLRLGTRAAVLYDLDLDGDLDIVEGNAQNPPTRNYVWLNQGGLLFFNGSLPAHSDWTEAVAVGDVDGDKFPDIVFGNQSGDRLLLGNGRGQFRDAPAETLPHRSKWTLMLTLVDLENDGDLDLFGSFLDECRLFVNSRGRLFDATEVLAPNMTDLVGSFWAYGDLNADGEVDLVGVNGGQNDLFFGDGTGRFARMTPTHFPVDNDPSSGVVLADLDRDGDLDVAISNRGPQTTIYINDGKGAFRDESGRMPRILRNSGAIAGGDVDGDGDVDLVIGNDGARNALFLNDGSGNFKDASAQLPADISPTSALELVDVDGDRDLDLVIANGEIPGFNAYHQNLLWLNDGKGKFTDATSQLPQVKDPTLDLAVGDIDGDNDVDLVFANGYFLFNLPAPSVVYVNDGKGRFTNATARAIGRTGADVSATLADLDGDGDLDLGLGGFFGSPGRVFFGDGKGKFLDVTQRTGPSVGEVIVDVDRDGDPDGLVSQSLIMNLHRQVWSPSLARLGHDWVLELWVEPGYAPAPRLVLPFFALGALPKPVEVRPYGLLRLDPSTAVILPARSVRGVDRVSLRLPPIKALAGLRLSAQALVLHGTRLEDARLTNMHADEILVTGR